MIAQRLKERQDLADKAAVVCGQAPSSLALPSPKTFLVLAQAYAPASLLESHGNVFKMVCPICLAGVDLAHYMLPRVLGSEV